MSTTVEIETVCPECATEMEIFESGAYKGIEWHHFKCSECGHEESNEPDWDSMKGGHDYE